MIRQAPGTATGTILVVDDDADLRKVMTTLLRGVGFGVLEARDGEHALVIIAESQVDVVLLDVAMPGLSGFEVMEKISVIENAPIVIFVSARSELDDRLSGIFSGAIAYITKPFEPAELVAHVTSALKQKQLLTSAQNFSRKDALTGLGNRFSFDLSLNAEMARSLRYNRPLALLMMDADGLKTINDTYGHSAGDDLICAISRAIKVTCRETDRPSRIGGDEFAILLPEADRESAENFVMRLEQSLDLEKFDAGSRAQSPSVSLGMALYPTDAADAEKLKALADGALYRQKKEKKRRLNAQALA